MALLWSTTMNTRTNPSCHNDTATITPCSFSSSPFQLVFLCSSFGLMSLGTGAITSSTASFGADQVVRNGIESHENSTTILESFFNWYCISMYFSLIFSLTFLVYIQDHMGWKVGFGVPLFLFLLSTICFFLPSSMYVKTEPKPNLLNGFARVIAASWRNRRFNLSGQRILYHVTHGSTFKSPTSKLRFLNKACIIHDPSEDPTVEGPSTEPWRLCTVDQVEEVKVALNIVPIWSTGIIFSVILCQIPSQLLQANSMDRHFLSSSFEIPGGSMSTFGFLIAILWLLVYNRVINPTTLTAKTRLEASLLLSTAAMVVAAVVETVRRYKASSDMSVMWLVPQTCLIGLAMSIGVATQIEIFYSELPRSMSSMASSICLLSSGIASLVASLIMSVVDRLSRRFGNESWVSGDVNKGHYDYYYWLLAGLSFVNYIYYLLCSRAYWQGKRVSRDTTLKF